MWSTAILGVGIGFLLWGVGLFLEYPPWLRGNIDPMGPLQLGLGLIVGFCLTQYASHATSARRSQREAIIAAANEAKMELKKVNDVVAAFLRNQESNDLWQTVPAGLKLLAMQVEFIRQLLEAAEIEADFGYRAVVEALDRLESALGERHVKDPRYVEECSARLYGAFGVLIVKIAAA